MTLTHSEVRLGLIAAAAFLITLLGITAMFELNRTNARRHETETLLYQLRANAQGLGSNEWEALANSRVDSDVHDTSERLRREILNELKMIHTSQDREGLVDKVQPAASRFLSDIEREFALISNAHLEEARELNGSRVDPDFDLIDQAIQEAITKFETETRRNSQTELLISVGILLASLASIPFLTFRFECGRNLQKTNVRLQELVAQLSLSKEELTHLAYHDSLTQLPNRALFMDQLRLCVNRTKQHQNYKFAVVFIDVDHFKTVNDSLGYSAGDQLIVQLSERLSGSIRRDDIVAGPADPTPTRPARAPGNDILARLGGDVFAILLDDIHDPSDGIRVAERIQRNLAPAFLVNGHQLQITVSTGIAASATNYSAEEDVWRDADTAMHRARSLGRSRFQMCDPAMHAAAVSRLKLEDDLRHAESRGELKLHYQPIVFLRDGFLSGFEALIRWERPGFGLVSPAEFIPVAEETGLMVPIGSWVLREACSQMRAWQVRFPLEPVLTIAVNFSAKQFIQPDFVRHVNQILRETGLDPGSLRIEFTESVAMQDAERTARILNELKDLGLCTSIDDFGTGYSSLSYLSRLPLGILKLDRSFVSGMAKNDESRQVVHTIISLGHNLGMDIVAEGIETVEQANELRSLGCKYAQGYFFSKPLDKVRMETLLELIRVTPVIAGTHSSPHGYRLPKNHLRIVTATSPFSAIN
jgi:predicted signal transduction protein with EAL and GGDEF domain